MDLFILLNAHLHFTMRRLIFMHKCTPKFKKYGILVQNWFHRGEKNAI